MSPSGTPTVRPTSLPDLSGRTAVVTGANSGIGRVTARELARAGAHVVLAVRDPARGRAATHDFPGSSEVRRLDLADLSSVREFAEGWSGDLHLLVANAGIMAVPRGRTSDGFESQFGTNHLGHFALTNLLLPHVRDRVVVVSSAAHRVGRLDLEDLNHERRRYSAWAAYGQSKLANLLFVLELQRRLFEAGSRVLVTAAHPGWASTNLQGRTGNPVGDVLARLGNRLLAQDDQGGALPTLHAATADVPPAGYVGPSGFQETRGAPTLVGRSAAASDGTLARELWTRSEELTGVRFPLAALAG
ncbi:SDR family NAD(P)-dependent oxidoreductase [Kineococcus sp. R8]|uniref:oxidoreductase n=1 Tax=Kineococcus siccus TaxID=2696567 RepID=UPI0014126163|nr:oxidoreductase [Kineococcus siccus]NAZ81213.1 SDR family NAD(P)-dependent oxidoreductase [Kineococcus siccus]